MSQHRLPIAALALLVLSFGACGGTDDQGQAIALHDSSALRPECQAAANQIGYPVPCPTRLPTVDGQMPTCTGCVAQAGGGDTLDTIFVLNVEGFDANLPDERTRHLVIEARRVDRAPGKPCAGATKRHRVKLGDHDSTQVTCPTDTPELVTITHGEAIHQGHTLLYWDQGHIRIVLSVHGLDAPESELLAELARSIEVIAPAR